VVLGVDQEDDTAHLGKVILPETTGWKTKHAGSAVGS
jgi:hypothetical protein